MKVKPKWTIKAQIRTYSLDISLYTDFQECALYSQSSAIFGPNVLPLKSLAKVLGLTYYEVWRWQSVDQIFPFSDLKPRRVCPTIVILVDDTRLQADVMIVTVLGKERAFSLFSIDVLNSDISRVWELQKVLKCPVEFWHKGQLVKRI